MIARASALATLLLTGSASAECRPVPLPESPAAIVRAFTARMRNTGTSEWWSAVQTGRGPMYVTPGSEVRLTISSDGGLASELLLLLSERTSADVVRLETAAAFLAARSAGLSESEIARDVGRNVAATLRDAGLRATNFGDTKLVYSAPEPGTVAIAIGRMRCD